jgi:hypothetical protein
MLYIAVVPAYFLGSVQGVGRGDAYGLLLSLARADPVARTHHTREMREAARR